MTFLSRGVLALLALLSLSSPCAAKYLPLDLYDMLGSSDLVVVGTIVELGDEAFVLKVETRIAGAEGQETVEVLRFKDWPCAVRWTPYAVGQRVLVCAVRVKDKDGVERLKLRSGGGEGEMPIEDGKLRLRGRGAPDAAPGKNPLPLDQALETIRAFRRCFKLTLAREVYPQLDTVEQTATAEELAAFRASSPLADALAGAALAHEGR
ncbi:MAG: hypothetical protein KDD82_09165 [Planctomycetes bacterium]|nr:hypothetical protein [Planctomycetota bacterium]